jgi:hypothetical protein
MHPSATTRRWTCTRRGAEPARVVHRRVFRSPPRGPSPPSGAPAWSTDSPRLACGSRHAIWRRIRPRIGARHPALANSTRASVLGPPGRQARSLPRFERYRRLQLSEARLAEVASPRATPARSVRRYVHRLAQPRRLCRGRDPDSSGRDTRCRRAHRRAAKTQPAGEIGARPSSRNDTVVMMGASRTGKQLASARRRRDQQKKRCGSDGLHPSRVTARLPGRRGEHPSLVP